MSDIDREIRDMDDYIRELDSSAIMAEGILVKSFVHSMKSVVEEWDNYTKPLLESLQVEMENKASS